MHSFPDKILASLHANTGRQAVYMGFFSPVLSLSAVPRIHVDAENRWHLLPR